MNPKRIVLIRLSHLGDVVHALPVYHALRDAYPEAELAWAIQPEFAELVRGLPGLERTILFGRHDGWRAWPRLRREFAALGPDLAVDAQGNLKSAAVTWCTGARTRVGLAREDWREPSGALALTEAAPPAQRAGEGRVHAMDRMLALAEHVCTRAGSTFEARHDPDLTPEERARGVELLAEWAPAEGGEALRVLLPSREDDVRAWPAARFAELAELCLERGERVLVLTGPSERTEGERIRSQLGERAGLAHVVGQSGLRELAAFFDAAGRAGARLVACDSGPLHLATACGLAATCLSGPQDADRTGPWPVPDREPRSPHRVVRSATPPDCAPCLARRCTHPEGAVCMSAIEPAAVL